MIPADPSVDNVVPAPDEELLIVECAWCHHVLHVPSDPEVNLATLPVSSGICEPCRREHFGGPENTPKPARPQLRLITRDPDLPALQLPRPKTSRCRLCAEVLTFDPNAGWLHPGGGAMVVRCVACGLRGAPPMATLAARGACPECAGQLVDDHAPAPEDAA